MKLRIAILAACASTLALAQVDVARAENYTGFAPSDKWGYSANAGKADKKSTGTTKKKAAQEKGNLPWAKGDQFWVEGARKKPSGDTKKQK